MDSKTPQETPTLPSISPVADWPMDVSKPLIIAGPCSAETREQVLETASALASTGVVGLLRAGIWKPRTRPGSFQGVGKEGLSWLIEAGVENNLPTTTEVANAQHVEDCLAAGVDVLWVGARTTVNPFSVQEIADALKGVDIPVIIKNPLNPDLQLWIGAIERFLMNGSTKLMAMHRGFATSHNGIYRNAPMWEIPIALKSHYPDLPILCDPSHIGGTRDLIEPISQKALEFGMHGLMIETHPTPDEAWSDAKQQLTPLRFQEVINDLRFPSESLKTDDQSRTLERLRQEIDEVDEMILNQLAKRMELVDEIGAFKKTNHITILQLERWKEILKTRNVLAEKLGLDQRTVLPLLELLHNLSIQRQSDIMNNGSSEEIIW